MIGRAQGVFVLFRHFLQTFHLLSVENRQERVSIFGGGRREIAPEGFVERSGAIMFCIIVTRNYNSYISVNFFSR